MAIVGGEFIADPLAVGGRAAPDVDGHIEERAAPAAHEFRLRMGGRLEMQAADGAGRVAERMVILHENSVYSGLFHHLGAVGFGKEAARVAETAGDQAQDARQGGGFDLHRAGPLGRVLDSGADHRGKDARLQAGGVRG